MFITMNLAVFPQFETESPLDLGGSPEKLQIPASPLHSSPLHASPTPVSPEPEAHPPVPTVIIKVTMKF